MPRYHCGDRARHSQTNRAVNQHSRSFAVVFSFLKAPTNTFTIKNLLRHYAKWARRLNISRREIGMHICKDLKQQAALRIYANQTTRQLRSFRKLREDSLTAVLSTALLLHFTMMLRPGCARPSTGTRNQSAPQLWIMSTLYSAQHSHH